MTGAVYDTHDLGAIWTSELYLAQDVLWLGQFGGSNSEEAYAVCADGNGVYVCGCTGGALRGCTNAGMSGVFVRKYDPNGVLLWTKQFGSTEDDEARGMHAVSDGVYVSGWTDDALPGQTSSGNRDPLVGNLSLTAPALAAAVRDPCKPAWLEWWLRVTSP